MVKLITAQNAAEHQNLMRAMHKDRKRIFIDILKWDLPHEADLELDQFDDDDAEYLIVEDPRSGDHLASLRLLRTDRPHLMSEVFPFLCEGEIPQGPHVREITRFCLSSRLRSRDRLKVRNRLVDGMIRHALRAKVTSLIGLSEMGFLSQILSAGWQCDPLGFPQVVAGSQLGAFRIAITPATLDLLDPNWRCDPAELHIFEVNQKRAA